MHTITVLPDDPIGTISPLLHGQFIEHLGGCIHGLWAGDGLRQDVVEALAAVAPPVVRWPGGCFADEYDWRDGIGPRAERPIRVTSRWGGDDLETHQFGTHEFLEFCRRIGAEPWFGGNVATATPALLAEWVEYCNYRGDTTRTRERARNGHPDAMDVKFWGIGNESWDCGGKFTADEYARAYTRFESGFPRFHQAVTPFLIACGPDGNKPEERVAWTRGFFEGLARGRRPRLHGYDAHFYTWNSQAEFGTATEFDADQWRGLLARGREIEAMLLEQRAILDEYDPERSIGLILGEWGTWHPETPGATLLRQQNTLRDAVSAAMTLDIFHRHADKLVMANLAQTVNVLQSLILTDGDRMLRTPTYHVFAMYRAHRGGESLHAAFETEEIAPGLPALSGSASRHGDRLTLSVVNAHPSDALEAAVTLPHGGEAAVTTLTHAALTAHNTFDAPDTVRPRTERRAFPGAQTRLTFPAASVTVIEIPAK